MAKKISNNKGGRLCSGYGVFTDGTKCKGCKDCKFGKKKLKKKMPELTQTDIMKVIKPSKKSVGKKSFKVESIKKPKMLPINMGAKNESLEATREAVKAIVDVLVLAQYGSDIRDKKNEAVEQRLYEKASEYRKEELLTDKEIGDKVVVLKKLRKKL
jgi:hypothetical protein